MGRSCEAKRRKDDCKQCERFMPIKAKGMCQNCWHKLKRRTQPEFFLRTRHTEMLQRCTNPKNKQSKYYLGKEVCSRKEFLNRFLKCPVFLKLFKDWKKNGYDTKTVPSIDRIDVKKGYTIDNMRFITHSYNAYLGNVLLPVKVYTKDKMFIREYESATLAARELKVWQANIWKVLHKKRKSAGGYYFEFK